MVKRSAMIGAAVLGLLLSVPCRGQEPAAVVGMTDELTFDPASITVRVGDTVEWVNRPSTLPHTVTADPELADDPENVHLPDGAETFDSGRMKPGDTFRHTFTVAGRYKYFCIPHEEAGMVAEVMVQEEESAHQDGQHQHQHDHDHDHGGPVGDTWFHKLIHWLGRFHPPLVDFPIALLVAAAVAELLLIRTGNPTFSSASRYCIWFGAVAAIFAGASGWFTGGFRLTDPHWVTTVHRWLGTTTDILAMATLVLSEMSRRRNSPKLRTAFRCLLFLVAILILTTGFFGGAIVYGLNHYRWP